MTDIHFSVTNPGTSAQELQTDYKGKNNDEIMTIYELVASTVKKLNLKRGQYNVEFVLTNLESSWVNPNIKDHTITIFASPMLFPSGAKRVKLDIIKMPTNVPPKNTYSLENNLITIYDTSTK